MEQHGLDSRKRRFTKKIALVSLLATGSQVLFQPAVGTRYLLTGVWTEAHGILGTVTTAPHINIDNGPTSTVSLVADNALGTTDGLVKQHTLANPLTVLDQNAQIRFTCGTAQVGGTAYPVNVVLELLMLSN